MPRFISSYIPKPHIFDLVLQNRYQELQDYQLIAEDQSDKFTGNTPLLWGIANASIEAVIVLLDRKIRFGDINVKDEYYNEATPLILTIAKGWHHKRTHTSDKESTTPMSVVALKLLSLNADVNATDKHGRTALHYAFIRRDIESIDALSQHGANWNIQDNSGNLPQALCFLDIQKTNEILVEATGGTQNYTYTLCDRFMDIESFCSTIDRSYPEKHTDLASMHKLNCSISKAINPLKKHAEFLSKIRTSVAKEKSETLLLMCSNIIQLSRQQTGPELIRFIQHELDQALQNPKLIKERDLLRRAGLVILNELAHLFNMILPKAWTSKSNFFVHQTKTEQLLKEAQSALVSIQ
jgi:hypothetical protein